MFGFGLDCPILEMSVYSPVHMESKHFDDRVHEVYVNICIIPFTFRQNIAVFQLTNSSDP
jgi:hypothetical protein